MDLFAAGETVDQSKRFCQFDESFDQRAAHVSLSSKSLRRQAAGNFCSAKSFPGSRARSPLVARHQRCRKFCFAEVSVRRRRNLPLAANSRSDSRIWNKSFSSLGKLCEADLRLSHAKPLLLSLRLHAQRKSGQTLLCNFYSMRLLSTTSPSRSGTVFFGYSTVIRPCGRA